LSSIHSLHIKPTFFSKFYLSPRHPHSFPTRRSSDLPNVLAPRKRPLHTIIPAFMQKDDVRIGFGIMGGFNQAQAHAQFVANIAEDRKSTRLNSSHLVNSYAVFCWKKKTQQRQHDVVI